MNIANKTPTISKVGITNQQDFTPTLKYSSNLSTKSCTACLGERISITVIGGFFIVISSLRQSSSLIG